MGEKGRERESEGDQGGGLGGEKKREKMITSTLKEQLHSLSYDRFLNGGFCSK